jgi:glycolate oxidase iron-sulfur subunit
MLRAGAEIRAGEVAARRGPAFPAGRARAAWRCCRLRPAGARARHQRGDDPLLTRSASRSWWPKGEGCCGALVHHMGREEAALAAGRGAMSTPGRGDRRRRASTPSSSPRRAAARRSRTTASCCATTRPMPRRRARVGAGQGRQRVSGDARPARPARRPGSRVAYHSACSMQHGQKITDPRRRAAAQRRLHGARARRGISAAARPAPTTSCSPRFRPAARPQGGQHRGDRPTSSPPATSAASPQIAARHRHPVVHTVELLDWAYGGPIREKNHITTTFAPTFTIS